MSNSYDEPRAHQLREAYHAAFGGDELPVPVESIAEDLLGLAVEVRDDLPVSGMLLLSERRIVVRSDEPDPRRRFTIAHELGHWVCQCLGSVESSARASFEHGQEIEDGRLYGDLGEKQDGIDVYARLPNDEYHVFQCRRTMSMGPADIRHSVDDFLDGDCASNASTFVLCTSTSLEKTAA
jgi:hypothetical protein